jgi:hypothetical protein
MASAIIPTEPITSEPVMVEASDAQIGPKAYPQGSDFTNTFNAEKEPKDNEHPPENTRICYCDYPPRIRGRQDRGIHLRPARPFIRERSYSPDLRREDMPMLRSTADLNEILNETDISVEIYRRGLFYIANHPFEAADIKKLSWLFTIGRVDSWVQKPTVIYNAAGRMQREFFNLNGELDVDRYDDHLDRYDMRSSVGIARLGSALRLFKNDTEKYGTAKVKFLIVVQGKAPGISMLLVSHSRQAAMVDILHEILNGFSILFVGAVLKDVSIPVEFVHKDHVVKFQPVSSIQEAEEVGEGVVGIIC